MSLRELYHRDGEHIRLYSMVCLWRFVRLNGSPILARYQFCWWLKIVRFLGHDCATRLSSMLQFSATSPLVRYFIYNCGEHGQYRAVLIYELVKHVFEFIKEDC